MALDLSTLSPEQQLAAIYIGYYDRAADPEGEGFWVGALANPALSLEDIATDFSTQPETLIAYPFFDSPTVEDANAFITELYQNLFNRAPDQAGLDFWSAALVDAINGEPGAISVGEIVLAIIGGAQDSAEGNDRTTILNKIEVATDWTDSAEAAGIDYTSDTDAQASAKSIIEGVTDDGATVVAAKSTTDGFFAPAPVPGETFLLTSATDVMTGTENDDAFDAYIQQNPFVGGVSNSLSSGDRLDGGAGRDRLYAELSVEFVGTSADDAIDVQPRLSHIEEIDFEAREGESQSDSFGYPGMPFPDFPNGPIVTLLEVEQYPELPYYDLPFAGIVVDGKHITDHEEIGSYFSDEDLKIENLTTLTAGGSARNTDAITVTMDHTDNFNTDYDAADLVVLFDNDYLLSGQESEGKIFYFLLDEDAELVNNPNRLNNIDVDGIRFTITNSDGTTTDITLDSDQANVAGTHQGFVNALQVPLQALIADGTLPAGTTLTLDPTIVDYTFLDDGSRSDAIPAIVLESGDGSEINATGFSRVQEPIGEYDVYGRFNSENNVEDQPIAVNIDLHKVGRGGDGGDLIIGGKSENTPEGIADGIEVFHINVQGAGNEDPNGGMTKPSNLGTITSTGNELREVYIATDPDFAEGDTFASLTVRNGFDEVTLDPFSLGPISPQVQIPIPYPLLNPNMETGDLELINADAFLGDLNLGVGFGRVTNADTITAQGGGDVSLQLLLNGQEVAQAYSVTTGSGEDMVDMILDGDALDYAGSSVNISTNGGDDFINVHFSLNNEYLMGDFLFTDNQTDGMTGGNEQLNQAVLDNVEIDGGAGDDVINVDGLGNANIKGGAGDDVIYTDGLAAFDIREDFSGPTLTAAALPMLMQFAPNASWAFNFDAERADDIGSIMNFSRDELPGEQLSLAYIGGATVTVTLSGAGINGDIEAGGGVMATDFDDPEGAIPTKDGYEASVRISNLLNGNDFFGTQADINAAVMEAINNDPILSNLLFAEMGPNNTLIVDSLTSGDFADTDLRIDITQQNLGSGDDWNAVEGEARALFGDSTITINSLGDTNSNNPNYGGADLSSSGEADAWYDGLSKRGDDENSTHWDVGEEESNLYTWGSPSNSETDNVINGGDGDDLIVLSTDATLDKTPAFTVDSNNAHLNGASNETIVMTGDFFGNDTVMNFTTAFAPSETNGDNGGPALAPDTPWGHAGLDFLDFTAYLTSENRVDGSNSTASENPIDVTLDYGTDADAGEVDANEVVVVRYANNPADTDTFGSLSAADVAALFNNNDGTGDYDGGALDDTDFDVSHLQSDDAVVDGVGKAVIMIENAGNLGEYKVFELTWDASAADGDEGVTANALGSLDFGDSLDGMEEVNLVGSETYNALSELGFYPDVT